MGTSTKNMGGMVTYGYCVSWASVLWVRALAGVIELLYYNGLSSHPGGEGKLFHATETPISSSGIGHLA